MIDGDLTVPVNMADFSPVTTDLIQVSFKITVDIIYIDDHGERGHGDQIVKI